MSGLQRTCTSCWTFLGVGSLREPGLRLAFLLLSSALGTRQSFSHTCTCLGQVAVELATSAVGLGLPLRSRTCHQPCALLLGLLSPWPLQGPCPSSVARGRTQGLVRASCVCARKYFLFLWGNVEGIGNSVNTHRILWSRFWVQTLPPLACGTCHREAPGSKGTGCISEGRSACRPL